MNLNKYTSEINGLMTGYHVKQINYEQFMESTTLVIREALNDDTMTYESQEAIRLVMRALKIQGKTPRY